METEDMDFARNSGISEDQHCSIEDMMKRIGHRMNNQLSLSYDEKRLQILKKLQERDEAYCVTAEKNDLKVKDAIARKEEHLKRRSFQMKQLGSTDMHIRKAKLIDEEKRNQIEEKTLNKLQNAEKNRNEYIKQRKDKRAMSTINVLSKINDAAQKKEEKALYFLEKHNKKLEKAATRRSMSLLTVKERMKQLTDEVEQHIARAENNRMIREKDIEKNTHAKLVKAEVLKNDNIKKKINQAKLGSNIEKTLLKARDIENERINRIQSKIDEKLVSSENSLKNSIFKQKSLHARDHNEFVAIVKNRATMALEEKIKKVYEKNEQKLKKAEQVRGLVQDYLNKKTGRKSLGSSLHQSVIESTNDENRSTKNLITKYINEESNKMHYNAHLDNDFENSYLNQASIN